MKKLFIYFMLSLALCACTDYRTNVLDGRNIVISQFPENDTLKGEKMDLEILGVNVLYVVDTFLIGFKGTGIDHFFEIYTLPDLHYLGKYIAAGRAHNELLTLQYDGQYQMHANEITMWLSDVAVNKRILFNLTKSLEQKEAVFDTVFQTPSCALCFSQGDSIVNMIKMISGNMEGIRYNLKNHAIVEKQALLKPILPSSTNSSVIGMMFTISPDGSKYVASMGNFNQINVFSADFRKRFSISYGEPLDILDVVTMPDSLLICYYSSVVTTYKHIYAIYVNKPDRLWGRYEDPVELHIFNWEGRPENRVFIPESVVYFAVDEKYKCIYGVKSNEEIYRYDLKTIL